MFWIDLGRAALHLGFAVGLLNILLVILGIAHRDNAFVVAARRGAWALAAILTVSIATLAYGFLSERAYDIRFIWTHSDAATEWWFQLAGVWAGQEGSLLFWTWILSLVGGVLALSQRRQRGPMVPWVLLVFGFVQVFFIGITAYLEQNPFEPHDDDSLRSYLASSTQGMVRESPDGGYMWCPEVRTEDIRLWLLGTHTDSDLHPGPAYRDLSPELAAMADALARSDSPREDPAAPSPLEVFIAVLNGIDHGEYALTTPMAELYPIDRFENAVLIEMVGLSAQRLVESRRPGDYHWRSGVTGPDVAAWLGSQRAFAVTRPGLAYADLLPGLTEELDRHPGSIRELDPRLARAFSPGTVFPALIRSAHEVHGVALVIDGNGINPLLANIWISIHPPMMYLGYILFAVPFAYVIAALITGTLSGSWLRHVRAWTLTAWAFLTLGNFLGGVWAYEELGWGGFWGWDPVENAALIPWFTASALIHALLIQERRGMFKGWTVFLAILTFSLTLLGTWITRSGEIRSVHAFAEGTVLGGVLLVATAVFLLGGLLLMVARRDWLRSPIKVEAVVSREGAFLFANVVLVLLAMLVLGLTLWPLVTDVLRGEPTDTQGAFWVTVPFFVLLLALMGIGTALGWRRATGNTTRRSLRWPLILFIVGFAVALLAQAQFTDVGWDAFSEAMQFNRVGEAVQLGMWPLVSPLMVGLALAVAWVHLRAFFRGGKPLLRNRRRLGATAVHLGLTVLFVGVTFNQVYKTETPFAEVGIGESFLSDVDFPKPGTLALTLRKVEVGTRVDLTDSRYRRTGVTIGPAHAFVDTADGPQLLPNGEMPVAYFETPRGQVAHETDPAIDGLIETVFSVVPADTDARFYFRGNLQELQRVRGRRQHTYDYVRAWLELRQDVPEIRFDLSEYEGASPGEVLRLSTDLGSATVPLDGSPMRQVSGLYDLQARLGIAVDVEMQTGVTRLLPTVATFLKITFPGDGRVERVMGVPPIAVIAPSARRYPRHGQVMVTQEVDVQRRVMADEFLVMPEFMGASRNPGRVVFALHHNPLVAWLWGGLLVMVLGTLIALWPGRRR